MTDALPYEVCPCCGQRWVPGRSKMDAKRLIYGMLITIGPQKGRVLQHLVDHFGEWVPRSRLASALYHDDSDGGPLSADNVVAVHVHRLRKQLEPLGLQIEGRSGRGCRLKWARDTKDQAA